MTPLEILSKMIALPSFSREEKAVADLLEGVLSARGLQPRRTGNNLWCVHGEGPVLLMDAHIDTVRPAGTYTRDPFQATLEDGRLYGLGSNDDGGSVVAMIEAFCLLKEKPQPYTLVLSLSAEEEICGRGGLDAALPAIEAAAGPVRFGLIGEPTSLRIATAEKGLMVLDVEAKGKSGHAAREEGVNAIYKALADIEWLHTYRFPEVSPSLGPVKMTVTQIQAGIQHNIVPDNCHFVVDVRSNGLYTNEALLEVIQDALGSKVTARSTRMCGSTTPPDHPALLRGLALGLETFGSPTLSNQTICRFPTFKLGPGDSARSHTADEYIRPEEIDAAIRTYVRLLDGLNI